MDLFNFIKSNIDILNVIGEYTSLKKTGSLYWKGRCPFHHEKTPSFTVSPNKNIFYCFGCHATGDVINFIEKIEHLSALEASQHLAQRYNLELPKNLQAHTGSHTQKTYYQLCYAVASWFNTMLLKNHIAMLYLQKRKIQPSTIAHFMLGLFPNGNHNIQLLINHISSQGFSSNELIDAHILLRGKQGLYSPFENRIIFPIKDALGQICGFGGRVFITNDTRPKYYNSMDSSYFKKGKILYGLDSAKHEIQKNQISIVVEGYMDCIALWQYGLKYTVATLGTACSQEHLQQLTKHTQTIYLLYDADKAGQQAMLRLTAFCWQLDLELKVITIPTGQDPASMLESAINIQPYIDKAEDIFNFFVQIKSKTFQQASMKQKMEILHELLSIIAQINNNLKQNILLMKASESLQIPLEILKNEYTSLYKVKEKTTLETKNNKQASTPKTQLEEQILAVLAYDHHVLTEKHELLLSICLSEQGKLIVQNILKHRKEHEGFCNHTIEEMITTEQGIFIRSIMFLLQDGDPKQVFQNLLLQLQKNYWKLITSNIKMKIMLAKKNHNILEVQTLLSLFEQIKLEIYKNGSL